MAGVIGSISANYAYAMSDLAGAKIRLITGYAGAGQSMLALERGASRPLTAPPATPLLQRDPTQWWKLLLGVSLLFNLLLMYWLLALPR